MAETWTVKRTLEWCTEYLQRHGDENPRLSAQWLLCAATGFTRVEIYTNFDRPLSDEERQTLRESLRRRGQGEPLQYITGEAAFRHIVLKTARGVLIPRPETELLVEVVLEYLQGAAADEARVLEVGCGTGCIALSIAKEAASHVVATDISADAVQCALRNRDTLGLEASVDIVQTDCCDGVGEGFDVLVSNPPYIPTGILSELPHEVVGFEPQLALDGGPDGLVFFDRLLEAAPHVVKSGGLFACELHETCVDAALDRLRQAGFEETRGINDLAGRPRFVSARIP